MTFRFVRIERAADYLMLGWLPLPALDGTPHGKWSVLMQWLCACPCVDPRIL